MSLLTLYDALTARLRAVGDGLWPLALRIILCWEFWEAGITKLRGSNWFAEIPWASWQKGFPFPFSHLPADLNWFLATWGELVFAVMLLLGLFTRFAAVSLIVVTMVATAAVHWPAEWQGLAGLWEGYVITAKDAGNFKLPLLFMVMLLPLVFHGGGALSLDRALLRATGRQQATSMGTVDAPSVGLAMLVAGLSVVWVEPVLGLPLLVAGMLVAALTWRSRAPR
ncbi:MAG: DoxX family membrane protein [Xanthomonadales bacterium]|nr:DoxX family membrane protein [Xanthomonadales bacterium]NIN59105.1 DoxX family membrane protein [Xanthomonadales bacterium]NIN74416.1 DoxX family membrane protein [Xanthomonadales bacterium]NIO13219.1 DoxX family membrane protein [Xanthomonadales bacterium]NIP11498.1 DoxX family membrane protein [Xanthomonadales bacterium]